MPNGGSDCCMTCWFNAKNNGQAGYIRSRSPGPNYCEIRSLEIGNAAYTYCANHPHRRPERDEVPIGPVMTGDSAGHRELWKPSPDTETIRMHLLALLSEVEERPSDEYPIGPSLAKIVIGQLAEFRETRAVSDLERIAAFDPNTKNRFGADQRRIIDAANGALRKIKSST